MDDAMITAKKIQAKRIGTWNLVNKREGYDTSVDEDGILRFRLFHDE
jgi:hypothetical protein